MESCFEYLLPLFYFLMVLLCFFFKLHLICSIMLGVRAVVLEKTLESPLDSKIKPVNPEGYQP